MIWMLQGNVGKLQKLKAIAPITTGTDQTSATTSTAGMVTLNIQLRRLVMINDIVCFKGYR